MVAFTDGCIKRTLGPRSFGAKDDGNTDEAASFSKNHWMWHTQQAGTRFWQFDVPGSMLQLVLLPCTSSLFIRAV